MQMAVAVRRYAHESRRIPPRQPGRVILVTETHGATELHRMLASLLPQDALGRLGLKREFAHMAALYQAASTAVHRLRRGACRTGVRPLDVAPALHRRKAPHWFFLPSFLAPTSCRGRPPVDTQDSPRSDGREIELGVIPDDGHDPDWEPLSTLEGGFSSEHRPDEI